MEFVIDANPGYVQAYWVRGMAHEGLGDFESAIGSFEHGAALTGNSALFVAQLARACAASGDHARARALLDQLDSRCEEGGPGAYFSVEVLAALGETERALDRLHAAYRQRNPFMVFIGVACGLDPLRGTRRFRDQLVRLGLPSRPPGRAQNAGAHAAQPSGSAKSTPLV